MVRVQETNEVSATPTINVAVVKVGDSSHNLTLPVDSTIGTALTEAGFDRDTRCSVGSISCSAEDILDDGDVIVVSVDKISQG